MYKRQVVGFREPAWNDPAPVAAAEQRLAALPQFASLTGPFDVNGVTLTPGQLTALHATVVGPGALSVLPRGGVPAAAWTAYRAESQFISADGRTVRFNAALTAGDPGSNAALHQVPAIRAAVAAVARATGASAYGVTGVAPAGYDVGQASDADLLHIIPVAISYLAAFGVSVLIFQHATGAGGLYFFIPFLMFVFLLALGEDYNILVMTRIREEAADRPLRQAGDPGPGAHRLDGQLGRAYPGRHVRSLRPGDREAARRRRVHQRPRLARDRHPHGRLPRPHPARPSTVALLGRWNWWPSAHGSPARAALLPEPAPTLAPAHSR